MPTRSHRNCPSQTQQLFDIKHKQREHTALLEKHIVKASQFYWYSTFHNAHWKSWCL